MNFFGLDITTKYGKIIYSNNELLFELGIYCVRHNNSIIFGLDCTNLLHQDIPDDKAIKLLSMYYPFMEYFSEFFKKDLQFFRNCQKIVDSDESNAVEINFVKKDVFRFEQQLVVYGIHVENFGMTDEVDVDVVLEQINWLEKYGIGVFTANFVSNYDCGFVFGVEVSTYCYYKDLANCKNKKVDILANKMAKPAGLIHAIKGLYLKPKFNGKRTFDNFIIIPKEIREKIEKIYTLLS